MRQLIMMEGDVQPSSTPLKDLFNQLSQGQSRVTFAQVKVLSCLLSAGLRLPSMPNILLITAQLSAAFEALTAPAWPGLMAHMHV